MDVISLHRFGFDGRWPLLGTALTQEQAAHPSAMPGGHPQPMMATAGTERLPCGVWTSLAELEGLDVLVAQFPDGMDPDEFIRKRGAPAMELALQDALEPTAFKIKSLR